MRVRLALVALLAVVAAPSAFGKGCVRIDAPAVASPGVPVRITVRTYTSVVRDGKVVRGTPTLMSIARFQVVATGPNGRTRVIRVRLHGDPTARTARIAFPSAGVWRLRARGWIWAPSSCAPPAVVTVG
jgi:hypothetical protein